METITKAPLSRKDEFKSASIPMVDLLMGYPPGYQVLITSEGACLLESKLESTGNSFTCEEIMESANQ